MDSPANINILQIGVLPPIVQKSPILENGVNMRVVQQLIGHAEKIVEINGLEL